MLQSSPCSSRTHAHHAEICTHDCALPLCTALTRRQQLCWSSLFGWWRRWWRLSWRPLHTPLCMVGPNWIRRPSWKCGSIRHGLRHLSPRMTGTDGLSRQGMARSRSSPRNGCACSTCDVGGGRLREGSQRVSYATHTPSPFTKPKGMHNLAAYISLPLQV